MVIFSELTSNLFSKEPFPGDIYPPQAPIQDCLFKILKNDKIEELYEKCSLLNKYVKIKISNLILRSARLPIDVDPDSIIERNAKLSL